MQCVLTLKSSQSDIACIFMPTSTTQVSHSNSIKTSLGPKRVNAVGATPVTPWTTYDIFHSVKLPIGRALQLFW